MHRRDNSHWSMRVITPFYWICTYLIACVWWWLGGCERDGRLGVFLSVCAMVGVPACFKFYIVVITASYCGADLL